MDHHVAAIDEHPVALFHSLDLRRAEPGLFQAAYEMVGHRADMALRPSARDHHVIGDGCLSGQIDGNHIFGLVFLQALEHESEHFRRLAGVGRLSLAGCRGPFYCSGGLCRAGPLLDLEVR